MNNLDNLYNKIINEENINKEEALSLLCVDKAMLWKKANDIRNIMCEDSFDLCSIINGKSGLCSENCKYCSQSKFYNTNCETYSLIDEETVLKQAIQNEKEGAHRFSIVTSGKKLDKNEIEKVSKIYSLLNEKTNIKLCASHGLQDYEDFIKLKNSGVTRIHNNLETSQNFFPKICSTHSYEDKVKTIKDAQKAGLEVCSGGIINLGESFEDRIDLAIELRNLNITSIPINILNPIKNTPLENNGKLEYDEIKTVFAIFRFINPKAQIRLAGGRGQLDDLGKEIFKAGANAAITGKMLTIEGISIKNDHELLKSLGFSIE